MHAAKKYLKQVLHSRIGVIALLAIVNVLVYAHMLDHFFYSDDYTWIFHGEWIKEDIAVLWKLKVTTFFSPVVNAYFYIGQLLFPYNHVAYHIVGLTIHVLNAYLVYRLIHLLTQHKRGAIIGAIFFSIIFYHYQAVIWISAIMHVLVTTFILAGLISYIRYIDTNKKIYLILSLLSGVLAFFTKENGIVFAPMIGSLYLYMVYVRDRDMKSRWKHLIWYGVLAVLLLIYTYSNQKDTIWISQGIYHIDWHALYPLVGSSIALFFHSLATIIMSHIVWIWSAAAVGVVMCMLCLRNIRRHGFVLFGGSLIILGFLPVSFFYFGSWLTLSAGRYSYLPAIGAACIMAYVFIRVTEAVKKKHLLYGVYGLLVIFFGCHIIHMWRGYNTSYTHVEQQMIGMLESFTAHESLLTPHTNIILTSHYPFGGNEYYRYMYRYFVDPSQQKDINDWQAIHDRDMAQEECDKTSCILLQWNEETKVFDIVSGI